MLLPRNLRDEGKGRNQGRQGAGLPGNSAWERESHGRAAVSPGQALTIFQRSLTTMQIQVAGLLQFAVPLFPTAEVRRLPPPGPVPEQGEPQLDPNNPSPLLPALPHPSWTPWLCRARLWRALPSPGV